MKRTLTTLLLMLGLCTSAHAALVYSFTSSAATFKFTAATFLTSPTTLQPGDLYDVVTYVANETLDTVEFLYFAPSTNIGLSFPGGGALSSIFYSFAGQFDQLGTYISNGQAATLTIAQAAVAVPEPGSLLLLGTALGALCLTRRRQRG